MASSTSSSTTLHPLTNGKNGEIITAGTAPPTTTTKGPAPTTVMSSVANLAQLLPTGTVLAYQALSPSTFTNHGKCETSNQWLTGVLVTVLALSCLFFSFTDNIVGHRDGKLYYGFAIPRGFNVFNFSSEEERKEWDDLDQFRRRRLRLRPLDFVHAFFTSLVLLTVAFSDVGLQNCFFPDAGRNTVELLKNLPMGMAFLSSFVFIIFPTKRKGIGFTDKAPPQKEIRTTSDLMTPLLAGVEGA